MGESGSLDLALPGGHGGSIALHRRIKPSQAMPRELRLPSRRTAGAPPVVLSLLPDAELLALARERNTEAFEVIYDRHAAAAYSLAHRICGARGMAEDAMQEAFLTLWRRLDRYDASRGEVRSWLLGIVHNSAIDRLRHSRVHDSRRASSDGIEERVPSPERTDLQVQQREQANEVRAALQTLPSDQRHVIELAYFGGLTHTQIASRLELPVGTIKSRMRLGLAKLAATLAPSEHSTPDAGRAAI
jgi:RNA polymerase sigma-70 factor (ECF subfamily)